MPKERTINPAAQQRKEEKRRALNKSKKQVQAQRNEKLAKRNPERLQRQIDELKELDSSGALRPKDKEALTQLEKDLRGIKRARDALGDAAPKFGERRDAGNAREQQKERRAQIHQQQHLGKRRRDAENAHDSGSDTEPDVRSIPMPRDTPPPIPRQTFVDLQIGPDGVRVPHALPSKPVFAPAQTVYSSAPQLRDLKKESVRFMPTAVAAHKAKIKGQGKLLEPEELDRLEKAGYMGGKREQQLPQTGVISTAEQEDDAVRLQRELDELERLANQEQSKTVQMEEVDDDGS